MTALLTAPTPATAMNNPATAVRCGNCRKWTPTPGSAGTYGTCADPIVRGRPDGGDGRVRGMLVLRAIPGGPTVVATDSEVACPRFKQIPVRLRRADPKERPCSS